MLIEFDQVSYTYPCSSYPAVANLNLTIPQGKRCALIGRNGCGKSTFFRLVNGLYRPNKGVIRFQDKPLKYNRRSLQQLRQKIGLVFQDPELQLVAPTVATDISYGLCNLELPETEIASRVQRILFDFQLEDLKDKPINYLSLGQKKRVSLANIMVMEPELLLLDEPTAYLDPLQTSNLLTLLKQIEAKGTTIVLATHDLNFVYTWADWILVMDNGNLLLEGTPETIFAETELLQQAGLRVPLAVELFNIIEELIDTKGAIAKSDLTILKESVSRVGKFE
jgi:cobalt/nickel transport system ATP-binding protein